MLRAELVIHRKYWNKRRREFIEKDVGAVVKGDNKCKPDSCPTTNG